MLEGIFSLWILAVILSLAFTTYGFNKSKLSGTAKLGWILIILYTGPIGLFFFILATRKSNDSAHLLTSKTSWTQVVNAQAYGLAGNISGIVVAAITLSFIHTAMSIEIIVVYISAFLVGWLVFQSSLVATQFKSYAKALVKTLFPELSSVNITMVGAIPVMLIMKHYIPSAAEPYHAAFWFTIAIATLVAGLISYPIYAWLIRQGFKQTDFQPNKNDYLQPDQQSTDASYVKQTSYLPMMSQIGIVIGTFILLVATVVIEYWIYVSTSMS